MLRQMVRRCLWFAGSLTLVGCGSGDSNPDDNTALVRQDGVAVVRMTSDDQMRFNIDSFTVQSGERVRLQLRHTGRKSAAVMGHNVVILKAGDIRTFASRVGNHGGNEGNGYLPATLADQVLAHTKMLGGGETDEIEFIAPAPGTYPFLCSFPGHFVTMSGQMIVTKGGQP